MLSGPLKSRLWVLIRFRQQHWLLGMKPAPSQRSLTQKGHRSAFLLCRWSLEILRMFGHSLWGQHGDRPLVFHFHSCSRVPHKLRSLRHQISTRLKTRTNLSGVRVPPTGRLPLPRLPSKQRKHRHYEPHGALVPCPPVGSFLLAGFLRLYAGH